MPFRFLHAADIHLDSPLKSLALRDPELADLIGGATRRAFVTIIDLCLDEQVDALLLAGDLYDGDQTSMKTARFLADQLRRLHEAGIRVYIIRGNHDALSKITRELTFPETVKVFSGKPEAIEHGNVVIHGLSFARPHAPESLLPRFRARAGAVNIGLLHTSLTGPGDHSVYAPCTPAELHAAGFRYWALGHIHKRDEHRDSAHIVMPGIPQGRDINESGAKSASLVTVADDGTITVEERLTSVAQFERVAVDVTGIVAWRDMLDAVGRTLQSARTAAPSAHLVVRLRLHGETPLAWRMRRDPELLKEDAANRAPARSWIEQVEIAARPAGQAAAHADDPIAELLRLVTQDVASSAAYQAETLRIAEELRAQLPADVRDFLGKDESEFGKIVDQLAREGAEDVLARLHAGAASGTD